MGWRAIACVVIVGGVETAGAQPAPAPPLAAPPTLSISELTADKATSFTASTAGEWQRTFIVFATTGGKQRLADVHVRVLPFQNAGKPRDPIDPTPTLVPIDGASTYIDREHPATFTVAATLDANGAFTSAVVVTAPGAAPLVRPIEVQVAGGATPAPIAIVQLGPRELATRDSEAVIQLGVHNTSDVEQRVTVMPGPQFTRKAAGEPDADAKLDLTVLPSEHAVAGLGAAEYVIPPGKTDTVRVRAKQLDEPGEYTGEVRLTRAGAAPVVLNTKIFVKRAWWCAALLIFFGVALAFLIGWFRDHFRNRQETRINLARIRQRLAAILPQVQHDRVRAVWHALEREGARLDQDISLGNDVKSWIELYGARVVLFEDANQAANVLSRLMDGAVQREKRKALDEILATIAQERAPASSIETARTSLLSLNRTAALRDDLAAAIAALEASVAEHGENADAELGKDLEGRVRPHLRSARALLDADDFDASRQQLELARHQLAKVGVASIERAMTIAPAWTDKAAWEALGKKLRDMTPAEITPEVYARLRDTLIADMIEQTLDAAQKANIKADALAAVRDSTDHRKKWRAMKDVHRELAKTKGGALTDAKPTSTGAGGVAVGEIPTLQASEVVKLSAPQAWQSIQRRLLRLDASVTVVVLLLAVLAGIKALWIGNPSWGSGNDLLTAFLWGTGFKVGADAFIGVTALRNALDKAS